MLETTAETTTSNTTTQAPASPANAPWYGSVDADTEAWVKNKGFADPGAALTSHRNLEKLLGAEKAGRAIIPPKDDAGPEEWNAFYQKLGRPDTAEGYKLPVPEGADDGFSKAAASWLFEAGVPAKAAGALAEKWNAYQAEQAQAAEAAWAQRYQDETAALQKEWGKVFEQNVETARRALREAGIGGDKAQAIERAIGVADAAKLFAFLGKQFAEAPMKGAETNGGRFGMTPEAAKHEISMLKADPEFARKIQAGDAASLARWSDLHKYLG